MISADDDQHDLTLFFLGFTQLVLASLQRLIPTLVNVYCQPKYCPSVFGYGLGHGKDEVRG